MTFDETTLLADVIETWGEYGAHADVLRHLIKTVHATKAENVAAGLRPPVRAFVSDVRAEWTWTTGMVITTMLRAKDEDSLQRFIELRDKYVTIREEAQDV